jgi:hypothetical protein
MHFSIVNSNPFLSIGQHISPILHGPLLSCLPLFKKIPLPGYYWLTRDTGQPMGMGVGGADSLSSTAFWQILKLLVLSGEELSN